MIMIMIRIRIRIRIMIMIRMMIMTMIRIMIMIHICLSGPEAAATDMSIRYLIIIISLGTFPTFSHFWVLFDNLFTENEDKRL